MKYLIITGDLVKTGGMDRANFALADYISRQGTELHLVSHRVDAELAQRDRVFWQQVSKPLNSYLLGEPLLNWQGRSQAQKIVAKGGKVIVNGGNCLWAGANWVHYVHAAYKPSNATTYFYRLKGNISRQLSLNSERQALKVAKVVISNSERTKQDLITNLNIPAAKIQTVYYGTDPEVFYPTDLEQKTHLKQQLGWSKDRLVVVFIGALGDRRKGFDTLFLAWQQLCTSSDWDVDLKVIGAGAELDAWKLKVQSSGLGDRIDFLGFRRDVPNLLRAADGLVAPTRYEAYGLGVQEAICCGLPAIVTASAGIAERYSENLKPLLLVDPNDAPALAQCLQSWRQNLAQYQNLIKPLTQTLRSHTWDDMAKEILQLNYLE
jgi:glycosyltransferase involved in cell wall biosynthesis